MKLFTVPLPALPLRSQRHSAERAAISDMLKRIFGDDVVYSHAPDGSPLVIAGGRRQSVSISHSATMGVVAVGDGEKKLGVDVENYRPQLDRVKEKFLSADELPVFTAPLDLLKVWTTKEAVYKAALTPGLSLTEIDCTRLAEGIAIARGCQYQVAFHRATAGCTIAVAFTL